MRFAAALATVGLLSGCTDIYLDRAENRALREGAPGLTPIVLADSDDDVPLLRKAATLANRLSRAYLDAARSSSRAQDVASSVVILSAASVVAGAVGTASDQSLANRGLVGVGAERISSRGVPKTSIESALKGAKILNCISTVATIYTADDSPVRNEPLAVEVTFGAIREVRIAVREDLARDTASFSTILQAFQSAVPGGEGGPVTQDSPAVPAEVSQADIEVYLTRLTGCLKNPKLEENTDGDDD